MTHRSLLIFIMCFYALVSHATVNEMTLTELNQSKGFLRTNIFGARGFGGVGIKFTQDLPYLGYSKFSHLENLVLPRIDYPVYFNNYQCAIYGSEGIKTTEILDNNDVYGIYSIKLDSKGNFEMHVADLYSKPEDVLIECKRSITPKTTLKEIEDLFDGVFIFE